MNMRIIALCAISALVACGGSDGDDYVDDAINDAVEDLTSKATYSGTFTGRTDPDDAGATVNGNAYAGGAFSGRVTAQADFDADQIDVQLNGTPKPGIVDSYKANYENARIRGSEFEGTGTESFSVGDYNHTAVMSEVEGDISVTGQRISGEFETAGPDRMIEVEGNFSANRQ